METTNHNTNFDINTLAKPYLAKWYWFIASIIVCIILGVLLIKFSTPVYSIQSSVLIKDAKKSLGSGAPEGIGVLEGLSGFGGMSTNSIENEVEIFRSKKLVRDLVNLNKLQTTITSSEDFKKKELFDDTSPVIINVINEKKNKDFPKKTFELIAGKDNVKLISEEYKINRFYKYDRTISLPFANIIISKNKNFDAVKAEEISEKLIIEFCPLENRSTEIQKLLIIDLVDKDATVINIKMDYPQVDKAKKIISQLIIGYNRDAITDKNTESQKTKNFIDDRIDRISRELGNVESEKERFKIDNDLVDIPTEAQINLRVSNETRIKALELSTQLELSKMLLGYINSQTNTYQVLPTNIGLDNPAATSNISAYNKLVIDRSRLLENATLDNPLVVENTKDINSLRNALKESLNRGIMTLQATKSQTGGENAYSNNQIQKVPRQEKLFRSIERQQQIKENLYLLLLQKREETAISLAVVAPKARIVDPVYVSDKPISPRKLIILFGSLIFGLMIPFGSIYLKDMLNNNIVSKNDIKAISTIPILAEIPTIKKNANHLIKHNDFSPLAESFRILMTNLNFMLESQDGCKVIMVTSSVKGEGKTFVSMNLSLILANTNNKVLLIGSDIRNPQLQRYNKNVSKDKGLTEYLYDSNIKGKDIIRKLEPNDNCDIIYSGVIPPNPTELLKNGRLGELIDEIKDNYQFIIIDTAPLLLVTDTFTITKYSDLILYVTRSNYSNKSFIEFATDSKNEGKIKNTAFVLNDIRKENFGYGNKYGYGYNG